MTKVLLRRQVGLALALTGCAHFTPPFNPAETSPAKSRPAPTTPFAEYSGLNAVLSAAPATWGRLDSAEASSRRAEVALRSNGDPQRTAALFEAAYPAREMKPDALINALGYLFKVDPSAAPPPPGFAGFRVYLPPRDTDHCGLVKVTDTSLVYLQLEGLPDPRRFGCVAPGLSAVSLTGTPEPDPANRRFLAMVLNTVGLKALEDTVYPVARTRFQQAFALDSTAPEYLANLAALHALKHDPSGGVDLLLRHLPLVASSGQLCGILGAFYEDLERYPEARDWALRAIEKDPRDQEWLINLSDALWGLGEKVQSKNVLIRPFAEHPNFRLGVYLADTYLGLEEYRNALTVLEQVQSDTVPTARSVAYTLRADLGLKRFEDGLDFIRTLGDTFPATGENLFLKGACEFNLKLYRQAMASLRRSLRLDPTDPEAQELQSQTAALLGDKSNQVLRTPLAPLRTTLTLAAVRRELRDSAWESRLEAYPITLVDQQIAYHWTPKGRWKKTRHAFFFVPDGLRLIRYSELTFDLNRSFARCYINRLRIYDSAWKPVYTGGLRDYYVTGKPHSELHPENLLVHVTLKRHPGRLMVELLVTEEAQVATPEFPYVRFTQQAEYPVLRSRFDLLAPPPNLLIVPFDGTRIDTLPDRITLEMTTPFFPTDERFAPMDEDAVPGFSASPFATWREVGLRYLRQLDKAGIHPAQPSLAAREEAGELTGPFHDADVVRDLFRFVRDSIRYDNYEFNLNASIPDSTVEVLAARRADCKGEALLLTQMLEARGIEAHLSLVNLDREGDVGQPNINQFNHMIVHIPIQRGLGPYYLDPSEKTAAFRRYPLDLEGRNTLDLDPENPRLLTIPELDSSGEHSVRVFHDLVVQADGTALGRDSLVLTGMAADEFRDRLDRWKAASRAQSLLSWLASSYTAFTEDSFRILNEYQPDDPLILVLRYHSRFPYLNGDRTFNYFPKLELSFLRFPDPDQRRTPVYFPHEVTVESVWTYRLPAGYAWKSLSLARELEEENLRWKFSIEQNSPETIVLRQQWRVEPFLVDPDEYRQLRAQWDPMLLKCGLKLAISKT